MSLYRIIRKKGKSLYLIDNPHDLILSPDNIKNIKKYLIKTGITGRHIEVYGDYYLVDGKVYVTGDGTSGELNKPYDYRDKSLKFEFVDNETYGTYFKFWTDKMIDLKMHKINKIYSRNKTYFFGKDTYCLGWDNDDRYKFSLCHDKQENVDLPKMEDEYINNNENIAEAWDRYVENWIIKFHPLHKLEHSVKYYEGDDYSVILTKNNTLNIKINYNNYEENIKLDEEIIELKSNNISYLLEHTEYDYFLSIFLRMKSGLYRLVYSRLRNSTELVKRYIKIRDNDFNSFEYDGYYLYLVYDNEIVKILDKELFDRKDIGSIYTGSRIIKIRKIYQEDRESLIIVCEKFVHILELKISDITTYKIKCYDTDMKTFLIK